MSASKRLIQAADEALAIARGEADPAIYRVHQAQAPTVCVREIRQKIGLTQKAFGMRYGFGIARVRDWEQGRTRPDASNVAFLRVIAAKPDVVPEVLEAQA
jgi:putative transcriptional regulator